MPSVKFGVYEIQRSRISHEFGVYRRFLDFLEPHVEQSLKEWNEAIDQEARSIRGERERDEFYEFHTEEFLEREQFKLILLNSFFTSSFALFEAHLLKICRWAQRRFKNPIDVADLRSPSSTERAKSYLPKLGVNFPTRAPEWTEIKRYLEIRNKLMHEGGAVPSDKRMSNFASDKGIVSGQGRLRHYELTRQFCDEALKNMTEFLTKVHIAFEEAVSRSKDDR